VQPAVIGRLKVLSGMDIAEKRAPQDGRMNLAGIAGQDDIDVRVASLPTRYGERLTLRLLNRQAKAIDLGALGFVPPMMEQLTDAIRLPHGLILLTGPTGSGKTTTLYAAINRLLSQRRCNVITVEDPVEYEIENVSQVEIDQSDKVSFHRVLRSILRHDPDIVLVGEIRDLETAENATQASLTGHLVFSTLHTNDAAGAFTRMGDMGVEPFLVAGTVEGVMAQRLLRRLCKHCREEYEPNEAELPKDFPFAELNGRSLYRPVGCRECRNVGYTGRLGIYELLVTSEPIRELAQERASSFAIRKQAVAEGMRTLRMDAWDKALVGTTSIEEVLRVTKGDAI